jgi:uncharacterized protein (TIGR02231 family)
MRIGTTRRATHAAWSAAIPAASRGASGVLAPIGAALALALPAWTVRAQETAAPITTVVLYPGSATVVRTAQVAAGARVLVLRDLTTGFALQTLRIDADPGIQVGQVETRDSGRAEASNPAQAALQERIQALQDEEAELDVQADAAGVVKGYLDRLGADPGAGGAAATSGAGRAPPDARSLTALIDAIERGAEQALATRQRVAVKKRALDQQIAAQQRDLERLRSDARDSRTLTIHLGAQRAGALRVSYQVGSAGWKPGYRAELDSATSEVTLERLAQISQKTGEDWKGVRVRLSTSQPRLSPLAPTPQPWLLSYEPPRPAELDALQSRASVRQLIAPAAAPAPMALKAAESGGAGEYEPPTFQADGAYATEFEATAAVNLPSDGSEIALGLGTQRIGVQQRVQVAPRLDRSATVTAEAERPAGVWPPGDVQLYRDGNYVGNAPWNPQSSARLSLSFGRDDLLHVALDRLQGDDASTGIFDKRNERRIADRISITSAHAAPVEVLVIEATPVSTSDQIQVQTRFDPPPTTDPWDQRRGVVAWLRTLAPGQTEKIELHYTIGYPKEGAVRGLIY